MPKFKELFYESEEKKEGKWITVGSSEEKKGRHIFLKKGEKFDPEKFSKNWDNKEKKVDKKENKEIDVDRRAEYEENKKWQEKLEKIKNEIDVETDKSKYLKIREKILNDKASDKETLWYYAYTGKRDDEKHKEHEKNMKPLKDYMENNPEVKRIQKEIKVTWKEMENNKPGHSKDNTKWFNLKKKYDELHDRLEKIKSKFRNEI
jgi:hypothetical protein